jgi:tRNA (Thr-GGU) A37 N-methylase
VIDLFDDTPIRSIKELLAEIEVAKAQRSAEDRPAAMRR